MFTKQISGEIGNSVLIVWKHCGLVYVAQLYHWQGHIASSKIDTYNVSRSN